MLSRLPRIVAVLIAVVFAGASLAADAGIAGQWRVEFATPLGQRGVNMSIEQAGSTLSGHVVDEYGEYDLKGRFSHGRVTATWSVPEHGRMLVITMRGTLNGNAIRGTATLGDLGEGALSARRSG